MELALTRKLEWLLGVGIIRHDLRQETLRGSYSF
jgi:hypothetical protein